MWCQTRARCIAHPPVDVELGRGTFTRHGFEGDLEPWQGRQQCFDLLPDRTGNEVAFRSGVQKSLAFLVREPAGRLRRAGAGERSDFLAQDGVAIVCPASQVIPEAGDQERGAGDHRGCGNHSAARRRGADLPGLRIKCLIEGPARQPLHHRTRTPEVDLPFRQWQVETPGKGLVQTNGLSERARGSTIG